MIATVQTALDYYFLVISLGIGHFHKTYADVRRLANLPMADGEAERVRGLMRQLAPREALLADENLKLALRAMLWITYDEYRAAWQPYFNQYVREVFDDAIAKELAQRTAAEFREETAQRSIPELGEYQERERTRQLALVDEVGMRFPFAEELQTT